MKILFMGIRDDERPALDRWMQEHPQHDVEATTEILSADTVGMVDGFDALTVQQVIPPEPEVYAALQAAGIRQISSRTAGTDMYDIALAQKHGIVITNVPVYSPNAIAEFALTSALYLTRRFAQIEQKLQHRDFRFAGLLGRELATLRVAVVGTGSIGLQTARLFSALGATVVGYDPYPTDAFAQFGQYAPSLEEALDGADVLTLHMPLMPATHHVIDQAALARLAPGAIVVNSGRGGLLDTQALLAALDSGHLSGAALDTYENEAQFYRYDWSDRDLGDPVLEQLLDREDVLMTPHVAFYTETAVENLVVGGLENAELAARTGTAPSVVSPA